MCQFNSEEVTAKVKARLKKSKKGSITAYKCIINRDTPDVPEEKYESYWQYYFWKLGKNTASVKVSKAYRREERAGIHVFLHKKDAEQGVYAHGCSIIVIAVECKAKDFVSAGTYEDVDTAVFNAVTVHSFKDRGHRAKTKKAKES